MASRCPGSNVMTTSPFLNASLALYRHDLVRKKTIGTFGRSVVNMVKYLNLLDSLDLRCT
jgi:hypothetical protein